MVCDLQSSNPSDVYSLSKQNVPRQQLMFNTHWLHFVIGLCSTSPVAHCCTQLPGSLYWKISESRGLLSCAGFLIQCLFSVLYLVNQTVELFLEKSSRVSHCFSTLSTLSLVYPKTLDMMSHKHLLLHRRNETLHR